VSGPSHDLAPCLTSAAPLPPVPVTRRPDEIFDVYRELYYEAAGSVSSVYVWDLAAGFASCWLIKKGASVCVWGGGSSSALVFARACC